MKTYTWEQFLNLIEFESNYELYPIPGTDLYDMEAEPYSIQNFNLGWDEKTSELLKKLNKSVVIFNGFEYQMSFNEETFISRFELL